MGFYKLIFEPVTGAVRRRCIRVLNQNAKKSSPSCFLTAVLVDRSSVQAFSFSFYQELVNSLCIFIDIKNSLLNETQRTFSWEEDTGRLDLGYVLFREMICVSIWYSVFVYWRLLVSASLNYLRLSGLYFLCT